MISDDDLIREMRVILDSETPAEGVELREGYGVDYWIESITPVINTYGERELDIAITTRKDGERNRAGRAAVSFDRDRFHLDGFEESEAELLAIETAFQISQLAFEMIDGTPQVDRGQVVDAIGGSEELHEVSPPNVNEAGPQTRRSPGPDVARGVALGIVAMSNTVWWSYSPDAGKLLWDSADPWTEAFSAMFVNGRAYPMFSFLFGYGIVQMLTNLASRGVNSTRAERVIVRRNLVLVTLGFLHALLLFSGDVLGAYGILGFICLVLARRSIRFVTLVALAFLCFRIFYDFQGWDSLFYGQDLSSDIAASNSYIGGMGLRIEDWATSWPDLPYYLAPMLFGVLAARRRILEEPGSHFALLLATIVGGFSFSILTGLPEALDSLDRWDGAGSPAWDFFTTLGDIGGIAGGLALAALSALLAHIAGRSGVLHGVLEPLRWLGRRSLSGYLFQSFAFLLIFPAYTLGLGGKASSTACFAIALSVWGLSLVFAAILERLGRVGPGEWLIRRAVYGRRTRSEARSLVATAGSQNASR